MKKRILWLLNHTTLRDFEIPMLTEMGFEVFTPKIYQWEFGDLSASVTYEYDKTLTIPQEALQILNEVDFYQETVPEEVVNIMNTYFDIAIFGAFTAQVKMLVRTFKGTLIFQAFGRDGEQSYTDLFAYLCGVSFLDEIKGLGNRFWFGASYENLAEVECDYFKRQFVYLPIGLKKDTVNRIWVGGDQRILFIGPKIMTNTYYKEVYRHFKKNFGDIPHVVGGAQMIPVTNDPAVLGFVPKKEFDYNMSHLAAMYYHSREPRHLHYHPLEAVANGMPLVFMAGGLLDQLGGKNLPGRCETIAQAHGLLKRLSNGDQALAERMISEQGVLLEAFKKDYCKAKWNEFFAKLLQQDSKTAVKFLKERTAKVAVVIPQGYTGGVLDFSIRLAQAIQKGAAESGDPIEVVLYHHDEEKYRKRDYFKRARESNLPVRSYRWVRKDKSWFDTLAGIGEYPRDRLPNDAYIMEDGVSDFQNFQYIIFTSDRLAYPFFTTQRYAIVMHDVIQRYVPSMLSPGHEAMRQYVNRKADTVLVTTPYMASAAVQWAGISKDRVRMIPQMFETLEKLPAAESPKKRERYFHWGTNTAMHKNHLTALNALNEYYANGGKLKCYMTGVCTKAFNPKSPAPTEADGSVAYIEDIRKEIVNSPNLKKNLVIYGELERSEYLSVLKNAEFTFHPGYADNGNGVCVEAAQLGVPTISADYPPMRYMDERMGMHFTFCDAHDASDMAEKLKYMEKNAKQIAKEIPSPEWFERFTWQGQYEEIYQTIRSIVRGY